MDGLLGWTTPFIWTMAGLLRAAFPVGLPVAGLLDAALPLADFLRDISQDFLLFKKKKNPREFQVKQKTIKTGKKNKTRRDCKSLHRRGSCQVVKKEIHLRVKRTLPPPEHLATQEHNAVASAVVEPLPAADRLLSSGSCLRAPVSGLLSSGSSLQGSSLGSERRWEAAPNPRLEQESGSVVLTETNVHHVTR